MKLALAILALLFLAYQILINRDIKVLWKILLFASLSYVTDLVFGNSTSWLIVLAYLLVYVGISNWIDDNYVDSNNRAHSSGPAQENAKVPLSRNAKEYMAEYVRELDRMTAQQKAERANDRIINEEAKELEDFKKYGPKS